MSSAPAKALALAALALSLALAGCTTTDETRAPPEVVEAVANTHATRWDPGDWWAYRATFHRNATYDIALVVHEGGAEGFRVGSNVSSGFFGLPFNGNVSTELNPRIGADEWPMYRFPLDDGKTWSYTLFGYDATTTAYAALVDVPGKGKVPGFRLESSTLGQVFAKYDYSPQTGWFTRLELIEPSKREQVLEVRLAGYGDHYGRAYFVERVIETIRIDYPGVPGSVDVRIPDGYARIHATLSVATTAGAMKASLKLGDVVLADAQAVGKGAASDRATVRRGGTWTLDHAGAGQGVVYLEVTGISSMGGTARWRETPLVLF